VKARSTKNFQLQLAGSSTITASTTEVPRQKFTGSFYYRRLSCKAHRPQLASSSNTASAAQPIAPL
jgi:hypothetical protein